MSFDLNCCENCSRPDACSAVRGCFLYGYGDERPPFISDERMTSMAHTPAPWLIRDRTVGHPPRRIAIEINAPIGIGTMEHPICRIPSGFTNQDDDARLIAAAPELLKVVKELADWARRHSPADDWPSECSRAWYLIRRIEG
jgi:hypothetical protein